MLLRNKRQLLSVAGMMIATIIDLSVYCNAGRVFYCWADSEARVVDCRLQTIANQPHLWKILDSHRR